VSYTLTANVENIRLTGSSDIDATGNVSDNFIRGNSGNDIVFAFGGDDTVNGGDGNDSLYGDAGSDTLNGGGGDDSLRGGAGRDTFVFSSGFGNDTLYDFTAGFDSIDLSSLNFGTYASLLSGTADVSGDAVITLSGNTITLSGVTKAQLQEGDFIGLTPGATSGNDTMNGLTTADNLDGLGGNDTIYGNGGDDILAGGAGNDYIDGGAGADAMTGGTGDDIYVVNHPGDTVTENIGEGTDTVVADTGWTLGANVENLTLTGSLNINGNGNSGNNIIQGNSGNNILTGNGGNDALYGNGGDDTLNGGSSWDSLIGGAGADTINGGGGNDWIRGGDDNDTLNGQDDRDRMFGEAGNDRLVGGNGQDTMTGGAGDDIFEYNALTELGDTITDFETGANGDDLDLIALLSAVGYGGADALGDGWVRAQQSGLDTIVEIDTTGGSDYVRIATLQNVTATEITADNWIFS
jgi:Ca2+-binding RTX toxin-like protein